jgi:hypothetical protein
MEKVSLEVMLEGVLSSERVYMKLNISVKWGLSMWWVMVRKSDSGMRPGWENVL